jgi:hypothetical protein
VSPVGSIRALHAIRLSTSHKMLAWCLRYARRVHEPAHADVDELGGSPDAEPVVAFLA